MSAQHNSGNAGDTRRKKLAMADRLFNDFHAMPAGAVFSAIGHAHARLRGLRQTTDDAEAVESLARAELISLETARHARSA